MNPEIDNDIKKISIKSLVMIIIAIVAVITVGTFAWLTYRSNDTAMVLTIGDINDVEVTLSPYKIEGTFSPVSTYTNEKYTNVTAVNNNTSARNFKLYYHINSIASELKISSFKYSITKSTDNGSSYSHIKTGNFTTASNGNDMTIWEESLPNGANYKYKVYIWLDSSGGNQSSAQGKTIDAELRAEIVNNTYTVVFNSNGGTGTMPNQTFTYGVSQKLNKNTFTKSGSTFAGWNGLIYSNSEGKVGSNEFLQYVDLAPYIDKYGLNMTYHLELNIRSDNTTNNNSIQIYCQNGSDCKYSFGGDHYATVSSTEWTHVSFDFVPTIKDSGATKAMLAFYGTYNTGNKPIVKDVELSLLPALTDEQYVSDLVSTNGGSVTLYAMWK